MVNGNQEAKHCNAVGPQQHAWVKGVLNEEGERTEVAKMLCMQKVKSHQDVSLQYHLIVTWHGGVLKH